MQVKAVIKVKGLTRKFGHLLAVDHLEFEIYQGEVFGFLGPNGAGKTTTVRMLTGVIDPTAGTATIQGHDIRKAALLSRAHIAVVPEEANVYLDLTVWQNIMLMAELHGIPRYQRVQEADRLLDALGLAKRKKQKARSLSKGLRQRLMLCAALVTGPQILFLDEPTSGLDVQSANLMRQIVTDMNRNGLTVFLTTHNMKEAEEMCSRVGIIDRGRIAAIDAPEKLRSSTGFHQFVEVRFLDKVPDRRALEALAGVLRVDADNRIVRLYTGTPGKVAVDVVRMADSIGLEIEHLGTHKPSLEEVFLHFTGEHREGGLR